MENASKALLMAGGILIGVLILALMVTLFLSSRELSTGYEQTKQSEAVQQFNVNFTQFMGQKLTIHQVITITNFAKANDVEIVGGKSTSDINKKTLETTYQLIIPSNGYGENGYIRKVQIN